MKSLNAITITGTINRDAKTNTFGNGGSVTTRELAYTISAKDNGKPVEKENWVQIEGFGVLSPVLAQLDNGEEVLVQGSLVRSAWKDKETDEWRNKHVIRVSTVHALGPTSGLPEAPIDDTGLQDAAEEADKDPHPF